MQSPKAELIESFNREKGHETFCGCVEKADDMDHLVQT